MLARGRRLETLRGEPLTVGRWVGEGSYARIYRATWGTPGEPAAVKTAKPEIPDSGDRLAVERERLARVRHPGVVRLLDAGSAEGLEFLVLEWLEGRSLHDEVERRRRLPLGESLEVLAAVLEALAELAPAGGHGDLRGQNVLLVGKRPVLIDPGPAGADVPQRDVRDAGELLHRMLTGIPTPSDPMLTQANGYRPEVVALWRELVAASIPAREAAAAATRLRQRL